VVQDALAGWLLPGTAGLATARGTEALQAREPRATDARATFQIAGFRCDAHAQRNARSRWGGHIDICVIGTETIVARVRLDAEHASIEAFLDAARRAAVEGVDALSRYTNLPAALPLDLRVGPLR
jgi:hypothetical protein